MNTTTLNMTTLDGGVIIKKGGGGTPTPPSGGGEVLEGEYYLVKPNGRYWKSKLARIERGKYPSIMGSADTFTEEQMESIYMFYRFISFVGFSGIGDYGGIPSCGTEISYFGPQLNMRIQEDMLTLLSSTYLNLFGAWQEGSMMVQNNAGSSIIFNGIVDAIRLSIEETDGMSDDEILAMVSEMCMMEQVTKEEYESWYNW